MNPFLCGTAVVPKWAVVALMLAGCAGASTPSTEPTVSCAEACTGYIPPSDTTGCIAVITVDEAIRPVPDVALRTNKPERKATTDANGVAHLCDLPAGAILLSANRTGYTPTQALVQVTAGEVVNARLTLPVLKVTQPYHETFIYRGYTDFSAGVATPLVSPTVGPTLQMFGVISCSCTFDVTPSQAPSAIVLEATWKDTVTDPSGPTEYVYQVLPERFNSTAHGQMKDPLHKVLGRLDFGDPNFQFSAAPAYHVSIYPDASWPALEQDYKAFVTLWYRTLPPDGWTLFQS